MLRCLLWPPMWSSLCLLCVLLFTGSFSCQGNGDAALGGAWAGQYRVFGGNGRQWFWRRAWCVEGWGRGAGAQDRERRGSRCRLVADPLGTAFHSHL